MRNHQDPFARRNRPGYKPLFTSRTLTSVLALGTALAAPVTNAISGNYTTGNVVGTYTGTIPGGSAPTQDGTYNGQAFQGVMSNGQFGTSATGYAVDANTDRVYIGSSTAVLNWAPYDTSASTAPINFLPSGKTIEFVNDTGSSDFTVVNRIIPGGAADGRQVGIFGNIRSYQFDNTTIGGNVWLYSPGGLLIGGGANINVGGLILSGLDPVNPNSGGSYFTNTNGLNSHVEVATGAQISVSNYIGIVAPNVAQNGTVTVGRPGGTTNVSAAYVAAESATLTLNQGLFDIQVYVGTDGDGPQLPDGSRYALVHNGTTSGPANDFEQGVFQRISLVAVPKNSAITMLVGGEGKLGFDIANSVQQDRNSIVLSAGYNVAANGTFNGRGGDPSSFFNPASIGTILVSGNTTSTQGDPTFKSDVFGKATGDASIFANVGTRLDFARNLSIDTTHIAVAEGAGATGGTLYLGTNGGAITVGGIASLRSDGQGGDAGSVALTGGIGQGGLVSVNADGGTINLGAVEIYSNGLGGAALTDQNQGGAGYGGGDAFGGTFVTGAALNASNGGTLTVTGPVSLSAIGTGGNAFYMNQPTGGNGGAGYGGRAVAFNNIGAMMTLGGLVTITADGVGGNGYNAGGAAGGFAQIGAETASIQTGSSALIQARAIGGQVDGDGGVVLNLPGDDTFALRGGRAILTRNGTGGTIIGGSVTLDAAAYGSDPIREGFFPVAVVYPSGGAASALGGDASIFVTNNGGVTINNGLYAYAEGFGGRSDYDDGATGFGGTARIGAQSGSNVSIFGDALLLAGGFGGNGYNGGEGRGGQATVSVNSGGSIAVNDTPMSLGLQLFADGQGGNAQSEEGAGDGGRGVGGLALIQANANSGTTSSITLGNVIAVASGTGGDGGSGYGDGVPVAGGNGGDGVGGYLFDPQTGAQTGGVVIGGTAAGGILTISGTTTATANGLGGSGGAGTYEDQSNFSDGGTGGAGYGGLVQTGLFSGAAGTPTFGSASFSGGLTISVRGEGGLGGDGATDGESTLSSGGAGGLGAGGSANILERGGPVSASFVAFDASGHGGNGGTSPDDTAGMFGRGSGGDIAVIASPRFNTTDVGTLQINGMLSANVGGYAGAGSGPATPGTPEIAGEFQIAAIDGGTINSGTITIGNNGLIAPREIIDAGTLVTTTVASRASELTAINGGSIVLGSGASMTLLSPGDIGVNVDALSSITVPGLVTIGGSGTGRIIQSYYPNGATTPITSFNGSGVFSGGAFLLQVNAIDTSATLRRTNTDGTAFQLYVPGAFKVGGLQSNYGIVALSDTSLTIGNIGAGGAVQLSGANTPIAITAGNIVAPGGVTAAGTAVQLGGITTQGAVTVNGSSLASVNGVLGASSIAIVSSGGVAQSTQALSASGNITLTGSAGANVGILDGNNVFQVAAINAGGQVSIGSGGGGARVGNINAGLVVGTVAGALNTGSITSATNVSLQGNQIDVGAIVARDSIGLTSTSGGVTYGSLSAGIVNPVSQSQQGYVVGIRSGGTVSGGAINARGNVGVISLTSTITSGDIGSQQSIVLLSGRGVTTGSLSAASTTGGVYIANSSMFTANNNSLDPAIYFQQTPVPILGVQGTPGTITVGNVSAARFRAASTGVFRAGNIAASTLLNLSSNSNFILGDITAPTITLAAPAIQTGALSSTGAISLNAPIAIVAGNVNAASLTAQSGGVARFGDISTSGDIFVGSFAPPQQFVGAQTPGTVLVGNVTSSGGGVNLFSQRGTVTTGNINVAGFAQLSAQVGSITTGNIQASEVGLFALGAITTGSVTATNGEIDIEAGPDDENDDFLVTPGADVITGALVATDEIGVTGGGNVRVASATINAPTNRNPEEFYEVKIGAGGSLTVGNISAPGTVGLATLTGAIATGNITTQDSVAVLAGGDASFGAVTTGTGGTVYVGNASQLSLVDTDDGIDTSLLFAVAPVRAGGAVSFAGPVSTGRFDVASNNGFSSGAVTASSVRVNTGGAASFGDTVTTPGAFTVSSGAFAAAGINAASVQVAASGAASFNGAVVAPTINVASNDIAIGANGSLGGASTTALTLTNSGTGPSTLGGTAQTTGYTLDASEIGRLRATQIAFNSTGNVTFNAASINAATALNGATGGFRVTTPASIRIAGNVDFTNMAATNTATFVAGQRFEVVTPTGQLRLLGANNAVNGVANITAANVAIGSATLLDQLAANPRFTGRDTALALGNSGTAVNSSGYIQAGTLAFTVGNTLLIANSGTATAPAGFTAGTGGVTVAAQGQGTTPIDVVIYGRSLDAAGTPSTSSGTVSTVVIAPGSTARISTTSTVNGCGFGGATCTAGAVVTNTVQNQLTQIAATLQSAVTGIGGGATNGPAGGAADNGGTTNNNAASDQGSDGEDDGGDDGTSAATSSAVRVNVLIDTSSIGGGGPSFDTPVTSSGNASLWGGDAGGDVGSTGAGGLGDTSGPLGDLGGGGALGGGSFGGASGGAVNAGGGAGASFGAGAGAGAGAGGNAGGAGLTGGASGGASSTGGAATGGTSSTGAAGSTSGAASTGGTGSAGGASTGGAAGGTAGSTSSSAGGDTSGTEGGASAQGGGSNGGAAGGSSAEGSANGQGGGTAATAATEGTSNSGGGGGGEAGASGSDAGTTPGGAAGGAAGGASGGANGGNNKDEKTDKPQGGTTGGIN